MPWHGRAEPALYFPQAQMWSPQPMFLIVREKIGVNSLAEPLRRALSEIDPELPLANVRPLETVASAAVVTRRLALSLVATFGITALFLAVVGVYGVIAQSVEQRTHEFGLRQALGATRGDIMRLVFSSGATMTIVGLAAGVALGAGTTRLLVSLLYEVTPLDRWTFGAVALILLSAAAGAAYVPARRATRISAASALRSTN
jgi:putative ABC transport system permease protein